MPAPTPPAAPAPLPAPAEPDRWRAPLLWRALMVLARLVVPVFCRLRVSGDVAASLREGPLILAPNHIGDFDPVVITAACRTRRLAPRMMATAGLFRTPVVGAAMRACGHIRVDRWETNAGDAVVEAARALRAGSAVLIYPEGRITLDPGVWPERAKTGMARMALATGAVVVPVAQWGAHEVMAYHGWWIMAGRLVSSVWRRPRVRVHFGAPVDLSDLRAGEVGHAQRASDRIMEAITAELVALRADEPTLPRYVDWTRPVSTARLLRTAARRARGARVGTGETDG